MKHIYKKQVWFIKLIDIRRKDCRYYSVLFSLLCRDWCVSGAWLAVNLFVSNYTKYKISCGLWIRVPSRCRLKGKGWVSEGENNSCGIAHNAISHVRSDIMWRTKNEECQLLRNLEHRWILASLALPIVCLASGSPLTYWLIIYTQDG